MYNYLREGFDTNLFKNKDIIFGYRYDVYNRLQNVLPAISVYLSCLTRHFAYIIELMGYKAINIAKYIIKRLKILNLLKD